MILEVVRFLALSAYAVAIMRTAAGAGDGVKVVGVKEGYSGKG